MHQIKTSLLVFLCLPFFCASAQDSTKVKIGIDYLLFRSTFENSQGQFTYQSKGGFSLEVPLHFKQVVVSPGLSYKSVAEKYSGGGLAAGSSSDLNHHVFGGYVKVVYQLIAQQPKPTTFYVGGLVGVPVRTWAKGSAQSYSMFSSDANWDNPNYKEDPSHLFKKINYGLLVGIESSTNAFISPALELRFLPMYGEYKNTTLNPFEVAILIGLGKRNEAVE